MYYYYQRWYDGSTGRFISQDPMGGRVSNPQNLNLYVYADDTPTTYTDPTGLAVYYNSQEHACSGDYWQHLWCSFTNPKAIAAELESTPVAVVGYGGLGISIGVSLEARYGAAIVGAAGLGIGITWDVLTGQQSNPSGTGPVSPATTGSGGATGSVTITPAVTSTSSIGPIGTAPGPGGESIGIGMPRPWPPIPKPRPYTPPPEGGTRTEFGGNERANKICAVLAIGLGLGVGIGLIAPDLASGRSDLGRNFTAGVVGFATIGAAFFACAGIAAQFYRVEG